MYITKTPCLFRSISKTGVLKPSIRPKRDFTFKGLQTQAAVDHIWQFWHDVGVEPPVAGGICPLSEIPGESDNSGKSQYEAP